MTHGVPMRLLSFARPFRRAADCAPLPHGVNSMAKRVFHLCPFILAAMLAAFHANAQVGGGGTIQGTVTDPSGAVVAGAEVTATNVATGVETSRRTNESGFFALSPLQPGTY